MQDLSKAIFKTIHDELGVDVNVVLTRPDPQFGDFATNVALQLAKSLDKNPREIAEQISEALKKELTGQVREVSIAGPGFINLRLDDAVLLEQLQAVAQLKQPLTGQTAIVEYSDPNPFKILHAGHLYTSVVGDGIANLLESAGAKVHRVNYGGDVGLHVGKTMWAILKNLGGELPEKLKQYKTVDERTQWLADCYIQGTHAYEDDAQAKADIIVLNKRVYQLVAAADHDSPFAQIYWATRQWSYDYFDDFYDHIGTKFDKVYPESEVVELGVAKVTEQLAKGVFEKSDGAIVFKGEDFGLHTRVFINSEGLPTYEAKEVGLLFQKQQDYNFDKSVVITGNEQEQYMAVVLKAVEQFAPDLVTATSHLTHGLVKLKGGVKMSSRKGNILRATDVLEAAHVANDKATKEVTLGAVKYAFLKVRTGGDIIYDPVESVSLEGNSGPYLQYAHARARGILGKSPVTSHRLPADLDKGERVLAVKLTEYVEVAEKATTELAPHLICTYIYELAQTFNRFYEQNRVVDDPRENQRLYLVSTYASVLKSGLGLLGIYAPEKM